MSAMGGVSMKSLAPLLALSVWLAGASAASQPLSSSQQGCVLELNKRGAAVVKAQGKEELRCLKDAARGKEANAQACVTADARSKVGKTRDKLTAGAAKRCAEPLPPFGYADATAVGDAAVAERLALSSDVFGPDLGLAAALKSDSKPGAACQAAVAKGVDKLMGSLFASAQKAKKAAFGGKGGAPPEDAAGLADTLLGAVADDTKGKVGRATDKLARTAAKKCGDTDRAALFPAACAAAPTPEELAACLAASTRCRFCRALADFDELDLTCDAFDDEAENGSCPGDAPPPPTGPTVTGTSPVEGATEVAPANWVAVEFDAPLPAEDLPDLVLTCDGASPATHLDTSAEAVVYVIPEPALPEGAECTLALPGANGSLSFATGAATAIVRYDPTDTTEIGAVPDDYMLVDDATTTSGKRIELVPPEYDGLLGLVANGIAVTLAQRDGWSPLQPIVLGFSDTLDPATIPLDEVASLEPDAAIGLFDIDAGSPTFGERIPFTGIVRSDAAGGGATDHTLILFPALNFRPAGRYGLVVTRDAGAAGTGAFAPSGFFDQVATGAFPGSVAVERAREAVDPFLDFLETEPTTTIPRDEVALAVSISIRTEFFDPTDWVSLKAAALAAPSPTLTIDETEVLAGEVIYRGTMQVPVFLNDPLTEVTRDAMTGEPITLATEDVPLVFRIPTGVATPMPIVIYQHGSPGSPEELAGGSNSELADAGYALIGIQDLSNRRFGEDSALQTTEILGRLAFANALPLLEVQTHSDMFMLLRAIEGMGTPGNFAEIDPAQILFRGISFGAHHSLGFLPFAPEVVAAVSHVGSGRLYYPNLHQLDYQGLLTGILAALPGARPRDVIPGLALVQNAQDRDDTQLLARNLYLDPLAVSGLLDTTPPSLLWIEGIGDSLVPNTATRAAAVELGIPTVRPVPGPSPVLTEVDAPVSENIAAGVTAGHFQYDPAQTQSCIDSNQQEGHFCAQGAAEVVDQMLHFFATALAGSAEIIDPF